MIQEVCKECAESRQHSFHSSVEICIKAGCADPNEHHDYVPGDVTMSQEDYLALLSPARENL